MPVQVDADFTKIVFLARLMAGFSLVRETLLRLTLGGAGGAGGGVTGAGSSATLTP